MTIWTERMISTLGKYHDKEVSMMYFLPIDEVRSKRLSLNIPACQNISDAGKPIYSIPPHIMELVDEDRRGLTALLGIVKDFAIGYKYDIPERWVGAYRNLLGIPPCTDKTVDIELTNEILDECKRLAEESEIDIEEITLKPPVLEIGKRYAFYPETMGEARKNKIIGRLMQITKNKLYVFELDLPTPRIETFSPAQFIGKTFELADD